MLNTLASNAWAPARISMARRKSAPLSAGGRVGQHGG